MGRLRGRAETGGPGFRIQALNRHTSLPRTQRQRRHRGMEKSGRLLTVGSPLPVPWSLIYLSSANTPATYTWVVHSKSLKGVFNHPAGNGQGAKTAPTETRGQTHQHPQQDLCFPSTLPLLDLWGLRSYSKRESRTSGGRGGGTIITKYFNNHLDHSEESTRTLPAPAPQRKENCWP